MPRRNVFVLGPARIRLATVWLLSGNEFSALVSASPNYFVRAWQAEHKGVANSLRFIWEHAAEPITVKDWVGVAAMSRRGLHKAFLENAGWTPGQELQRVWIERAKRLLAESSNKLEVLAGQWGYQSANTFCVAFKQATGMSPKQFRDSVVR